MNSRLIPGLFAFLSGCSLFQRPPPARPPQFFVGAPYEIGGEWQYPQVYNNYSVTGLSTVISGHGNTLNADNEAYDPNAIAAASPVLQLPAVVTLTNLVNGYSMDVRVNDRGPNVPGRVIAVTPRVASMLGYPDGGVVEVQVTLKPQDTAALDGALGQGPKLTAAPVAGIQSQSLGPPGAAGSAAVQTLTQSTDNSAVALPQLSGQVTQGPPGAGPLYVQIPGFGRVRDAQRAAAALYGMPNMVVPTTDGSRVLYAVNVGPYRSVEAADQAFQQILSHGFTDPQIIVR